MGTSFLLLFLATIVVSCRAVELPLENRLSDDIDVGLDYAGFCRDIYTEIINPEYYTGTLVTDGCDGSEIFNCRWILQSDQPVADVDDGNETIPISKKKSFKISFVDFDISPINLNMCDEQAFIDEVGGSGSNVESQNFDTFYDEDYSYYSPCHFNYLNVSYLDENNDEILIRRICGSGTVPDIITEPGKSILIHAHLTRPYKGFMLKFERIEANETVLEEQKVKCSDGYFQCPDYSNRCIPVNFFLFIPLPFLYIALQDTFECDANVDCPGGGDESMCSSNEQLRAKQMLRASKSTDSGCGTDRYQRGRSGAFQSENYPKFYSNNARCMWYISTAEKTASIFK